MIESHLVLLLKSLAKSLLVILSEAKDLVFNCDYDILRPLGSLRMPVQRTFARVSIVLLFAAALLIPAVVHAFPDNRVTIYLFWTTGCPHCLQEKQFLDRLARQDPAITVVLLEVSENQQNLSLLKNVAAALQAEVPGVPFTVVANQYFAGWQDEATTGQALLRAIARTRDQGLPDVVTRLLTSAPQSLPPPTPAKTLPETLRLPFIGEVPLKYFSLGLLTLVIGLLDGFNPCAMWVLVFLINLLLGMEDRRKMWLLGGAFITTSAGVYFLFMTAWLNFLVFVGFIIWVRVAIGLAALFAGGYNLWEYWSNRTGACKLTGTARRQKRMDRINAIVRSPNFWLALGGIILLAFAVNLVELFCSAGFPVVYMQVLSLTPLPFWQYYLYLAGYVFFFMLDDMVVFVVAMVTLEMLGLGTRYKRVSNLIGGVLMLILGLLLIFRPQALMFG